MSRVALYPGSFDPVTYGHLDLIVRATHVFDEVIVGVAHNIHKAPLFSLDERVAMLAKATQDITKIRIEAFDGLVVDYAKKNNIGVMIRGLRMISDFEYEFQMALTNRRLSEEIETVFLMPSERYSYLSSTLLKEVAALGGDVSSFVPDFVAGQLKEKLKK